MALIKIDFLVISTGYIVDRSDNGYNSNRVMKKDNG